MASGWEAFPPFSHETGAFLSQICGNHALGSRHNHPSGCALEVPEAWFHVAPFCQGQGKIHHKLSCFWGEGHTPPSQKITSPILLTPGSPTLLSSLSWQNLGQIL